MCALFDYCELSCFIAQRSLLEIIVDNAVLGLPPWIIFDPSRDLRNVGIVANLVTRLHGPIGPSITAKSAWNNSAVKASTRQELKAFMTRSRVHVCVCMRACERARACAHTHPCVNVRTCVTLRGVTYVCTCART